MKFSALLFLFALAGCSAGRIVKTDKAEGVNLQSYKTFDFLKFEASGDTAAQRFESYAGILRNAVARELAAKGYTQSSANPDLLVNIGAVVKEETQTRETNIREAPRYIGQRNYSWKSEEVPVGQYKSGTVTIELVDSKKNSMVWQGVVEGIISDKRKTYENDVNKAMTDLFAKFPG